MNKYSKASFASVLSESSVIISFPLNDGSRKTCGMEDQSSCFHKVLMFHPTFFCESKTFVSKKKQHNVNDKNNFPCNFKFAINLKMWQIRAFLHFVRCCLHLRGDRKSRLIAYKDINATLHEKGCQIMRSGVYSVLSSSKISRKQPYCSS